MPKIMEIIEKETKEKIIILTNIAMILLAYIVSRVFKSRQRKRKNISIVLSSQEKGLSIC